MTAHVLHIRRDEALIGSDTLIYAPDNSPIGFGDKVHPLNRLRAVIFSRGSDHITMRAAATLALSYNLQILETVAEALPDLLRALTEEFAADQGIDDPAGLILLEARLFGWSPAEKRFRLWTFDNYTNFEPPSAR